ncbi:MAG: hypothetical protein ABIK44_05295 [candidate division WOR-3 bacterium]
MKRHRQQKKIQEVKDSAGLLSTNRIYFGDNLEVLRTLPDGCVNLIYEMVNR